MNSRRFLLLLAISIGLAFLFAATWVVVMAASLPSTDAAFGQGAFSHPLVMPTMCILALVSGILVSPFTFVLLKDRELTTSLSIVLGFTLAAIIGLTPFNSFLGFVFSFVAYFIGLVVARQIAPITVENAHVTKLQFSLRTFIVVVTCAIMLVAVVATTHRMLPRNELIRAAYLGDIERLELLLKEGADPSLRDGSNGTALMYAAAEGHRNIIEALLHHGAAVDARARFGRTPLMFAARNGHLEAVEFLFEQGADLTLRDESGSSANDLAKIAGHQDIVNYLKQHLR